MRVRLKAVYTLVEQLYTGAQRAIVAVSHKKQPPSLIKEMLEKLSVLLQRVEELKWSAARAGAITALSRVKVGQAELDPKELATGCPSLKEDGSPFEAADFTKCVKEMCPLASKLAEETDLQNIRRLTQNKTQKYQRRFMRPWISSRQHVSTPLPLILIHQPS
jgi:hypothetical protein